MYGYGHGGPLKLAAYTSGGGTLAYTGMAGGSWLLAGIGLVVIGILIAFLTLRARRS